LLISLSDPLSAPPSLQRLRALEDDLRAARMRADERTAEASSAREQLVREQGLSAAAQERAAVSERQLSIAQERLGKARVKSLFLIVHSTSLLGQCASPQSSRYFILFI
jgi:hypothetical protein